MSAQMQAEASGAGPRTEAGRDRADRPAEVRPQHAIQTKERAAEMSHKRFIVGEWTVDPSTNTLLKEDRTVALAPRLIDLLVYLAQHPGEVVSRNTLVESVWDRSIVTDQAVTQSIFELRKSLRDGRSAREAREYIQTIPKRGYRLVAPVRFIEAPAAPASVPASAGPSAPAEAPEATAAVRTAPPPEPSAAASASRDEADDAEEADEAKEGFGSKVAEFARNFWLNESVLGFKKTRY